MLSSISLSPFKTMYDQLKNQEYTDISFICNDGEISAHYSILAANASWFERTYGKGITTVLVDFSKKHVEDFLELVYTGQGNYSDAIPVRELLEIFQCSYIENCSAPNSPDLLESSSSFQANKQFVVNPYSPKFRNSKKKFENQITISNSSSNLRDDNQQLHSRVDNKRPPDDIEDQNLVESNNDGDQGHFSRNSKKKKNDNSIDKDKNPTESDSDVEFTHSGRYRRISTKQTRNKIIVDSTDEEDSDGQNSDEQQTSRSRFAEVEREVMKYESVSEMKQKLSEYCVLCKKFVPESLKKHPQQHSAANKPGVCRYCSLKFNYASVMQLHFKVCPKKPKNS